MDTDRRFGKQDGLVSGRKSEGAIRANVSPTVRKRGSEMHLPSNASNLDLDGETRGGRLVRGASRSSRSLQRLRDWVAQGVQLDSGHCVSWTR